MTREFISPDLWLPKPSRLQNSGLSPRPGVSEMRTKRCWVATSSGRGMIRLWAKHRWWGSRWAEETTLCCIHVKDYHLEHLLWT